MDHIENADSNAYENKPMVVGIGASAGGIQALKKLFSGLLPDTGMSFIVILHLSPSHDSSLATIIQSVTSIPVSQVTEEVKIEPDHIYVISPNHHLTMEDGHLQPIINQNMEDRRAPVDILFRTMAEAHGPNAVCVILSGTGADGSMGLRRIKERDGAVFVQSPTEAEFNEMPRNAIATDLVDDILPLDEIIPQVIAYKKNWVLYRSCCNRNCARKNNRMHCGRYSCN